MRALILRKLRTELRARPTFVLGEGFAAFELIGWIQPVARTGVFLAIVILVGCRIARRPATPWLDVFLPLLTCVMTAILYVPLLARIDTRIDRVAGRVYEHAPALRALAIAVLATLGLSLLFIAATRRRHTRADTRHAALAIPLVLCSFLAAIYFLFIVIPSSDDWFPTGSFKRVDRLVPFRACRGAIVWTEGPYPGILGRVDDVWLRFADPRKGGAPTWAASVSGWGSGDYFWLDHADAARFFVRSDDPAVIRCDSTARPDPVSPAAWHRLGF